MSAETRPWSRSKLPPTAPPPKPAGFAPLALHARDLCCTRGGRVVFARLTFSVASGQLLALTGANGAGKSSLLRILAGLLGPESGSLAVEGRAEEEARAHYLGHSDALKPTLTLRETLRFWAAVYDGAGDLRAAAARVGIGHALELPVGVLSAGQRRRAGLARLLIASRPLWLLDEPVSALDRDGEAMLADLMQDHLSAGGAIIAAIHGPLPVKPDAVLHLSPLE